MKMVVHASSGPSELADTILNYPAIVLKSRLVFRS